MCIVWPVCELVMCECATAICATVVPTIQVKYRGKSLPETLERSETLPYLNRQLGLVGRYGRQLSSAQLSTRSIRYVAYVTYVSFVTFVTFFTCCKRHYIRYIRYIRYMLQAPLRERDHEHHSGNPTKHQATGA